MTIPIIVLSIVAVLLLALKLWCDSALKKERLSEELDDDREADDISSDNLTQEECITRIESAIREGDLNKDPDALQIRPDALSTWQKIDPDTKKFLECYGYLRWEGGALGGIMPLVKLTRSQRRSAAKLGVPEEHLLIGGVDSAMFLIGANDSRVFAITHDFECVDIFKSIPALMVDMMGLKEAS